MSVAPVTAAAAPSKPTDTRPEPHLAALISFPNMVPVNDETGQTIRESTYMSSKHFTIEVYPSRRLARVWNNRARNPAQVTTASLDGASWMLFGDVKT
jgi:hypothetical protein